MTIRTIVVLLSVLMFGFDAPNTVRVFLVGDSTMADKPLIDNPEHGWGQMIPAFFSRDVIFYNHAKNGRSTKNFITEGRWDSVMNRVREGDYVLIQFGHNDSKKEDSTRYAEAHTDYRINLLRFVSDVRSKKGIPVLITPVNRRNFDLTGAFVDKHGDYPLVVREVAAQQNAALIDLHKKSKALFEQLGDEKSKALFLVSVKPNTYRALPNGKIDNTHFTRIGAVTIAQLVVDGIKELNLPLRNFIIQQKNQIARNSGIVVGLDQYYNNEWKKNKDSVMIRYHYSWTDSVDSGFSELAKVFDRNGADLDTLNGAPTDSSLRRFSIYIIVDPDTPKETAAPNYLQEWEIASIERWVRNGGMLVLMGNDKGNSEFTNFNLLSKRFGIQFNEDMHQDVKNNQYDSGKVSVFPKHQMFDNVQHVFIKQLSSLTLTTPAKEILRSRGVTVMAEASVGQGNVFAIGDPWLYNEYFDNRRLPAGYENAGAANGFVQWLCSQAKKVRE